MIKTLKKTFKKISKALLKNAERISIAAIILLLSAQVSFAENMILCGENKCDLDGYNCIKRTEKKFEGTAEEHDVICDGILTEKGFYLRET